MKTSKIDKNKIHSLIQEEAKVIKRKKELYESVKQINEELKTLSEIGLAGSFGFQGDKHEKSATGIANPENQNISHIAQLDSEMSAEDKIEEVVEADQSNSDVEKTKKENELLKKQLEDMKKSIEGFLKTSSSLNEDKK